MLKKVKDLGLVVSVATVGLVLSVLLVSVFSLTGCSEADKSVTDDMIMATIGDTKITRADLGEDLVDAEKEVIQNYIYTKLATQFISDVEVTDEEVDTQMALLKAQIGDESWPQYLLLYGGGSEDTFKDMVRESMKQEKKITEKGKTIEITDDELKAAYDLEPDTYNIVVMDVIFLNAENMLTQAKGLYDEGKKLEEISQALNLEISKDEHAYFDSEIVWEKDISTLKVGDMNITTSDSGNYIVGVVKELHKGLDDELVKQDMKEELQYEKGYALLNKEYQDFLRTQTATILGENFALIEDETLEDESDIVDTAMTPETTPVPTAEVTAEPTPTVESTTEPVATEVPATQASVSE